MDSSSTAKYVLSLPSRWAPQLKYRRLINSITETLKPCKWYGKWGDVNYWSWLLQRGRVTDRDTYTDPVLAINYSISYNKIMRSDMISQEHHQWDVNGTVTLSIMCYCPPPFFHHFVTDVLRDRAHVHACQVIDWAHELLFWMSENICGVFILSSLVHSSVHNFKERCYMLLNSGQIHERPNNFISNFRAKWNVLSNVWEHDCKYLYMVGDRC